jgi:hypothetical protein
VDPNLSKSPNLIVPHSGPSSPQNNVGSTQTSQNQPQLAQIPSQPIPDPNFHSYTDNALRQTPPPLPKKNVNKKVLAIVLLVFLLVVLPVTFFILSNRPKEAPVNTVTKATISPDTLIAEFNGEKIYYKDLVTVAKEQYSGDAIDSQAIKDALDIFSERKTLDIERTDKGIEVTDDEIKQKQEADGITSTQAYYAILKEKTTKIEAKNWEVFVIGFWVPPSNQQQDLTAEEKQTVKTQLEEGLKALDEAEALLKTDKTAVDIATELTTKYQSLGKVLGVNGYIVTQAKESGDLTELENPKVYTFEPGNAGQPFYDTVYSLKTPGEVKKAISDEESGGNVIKLINSNGNTSFDSYDQWLASRKKSLLKIVYNL